MSARSPIALVTGSARRVGRAIALELADAGLDVAVHYRSSQEQARQTADLIEAKGRRASILQGDLSRAQSWEHLVAGCVEALGGLDVLVNNAAVFDPGRLDEFDADAWERIMRINLTSVAGLCHHAAVHLRRSAAGCIVNMCDIAAERPFRKYLAYSCSKAGVAALTQALAVDLAPDVRVNAVSPGIAVFPADYSEQRREQLVQEVPLKREGGPDEMARAVRYLAVDAHYVTGQIIRVDGGRSVRW